MTSAKAGLRRADVGTPTAFAASSREPAGAGRVSGMLKPGDKAPDFTLQDQGDNPVALSGLRGHKVLVHFYP